MGAANLPPPIDVHRLCALPSPASYLGLAFFCVWLLLFLRALQVRARERRTARALEAAFKAVAPLEAGPAFLSGRVEYAKGEETAVEIHIEQVHTRYLGQWWRSEHVWVESSRKTLARPFYIRRPDKTRIRIEPSGDTVLAQLPNRTIPKSYTQRTEVAALVAGTNVQLMGEISRGHDPEARVGKTYRDAPDGWILRPSQGKPFIVSSEPMSQIHIGRAAQYGSIAKRLLFSGVLLCIALGANLVSVVAGQTATCLVMDKERTTTWREESGEHYYLTIPAGFDETQDVEVRPEDFYKIEKGSLVTYRAVSVLPSFGHIGATPDLFLPNAVIGGFLTLLAMIVYAHGARPREWYESKRVSDDDVD